MRSFFIALCATVVLLSSCGDNKENTAAEQKPSFSLDSAKAQIAASNAIYGVAFGKNDSVNFVNSYTSDGCIYPPGFPKMCGRGAIGTFFSSAVKMGIREIRLNTDEVMGGPEVVVETGNYEVFGDNNISFENGKFIVVWKQEDGKWKMHRDEWNSDAPPPAAPK